MKFCLACGMPLLKKEDFANSDEKSDFCLYCVDEKGEVKSCEEIFTGGVNFFLGHVEGNKEFAEKIVRKNMNSLPYWQTRNENILKGESATDDEFAAVMAKVMS